MAANGDPELDFEEPEDLEELLPYMDEEPEGVDEEELLEYTKPVLCEDFSTAIVVDNLPKIPKAKYDKLLGVLRKVFGQMGKITEGGLHMPLEADESKTAGFAYVNFSAPEEAAKAVQCIDGWNLDKAHALKVSAYDDLKKFASVPDEYVPPEKPEFKPRIDPSGWLSDKANRDQFVIRYATETQVMWSEKGPPKLAYGGEREKERGLFWCERYVMWSPQGTYLTTFHRPGVAIWGGNTFEKQGRFAHANVHTITYSPQENYMITCNYATDDRAFVVWDLRNQKELRSFPVTTLPDNPDKGPMMFKWSHDDKYVARMGADLISIYELPSMKLLDKRSLRAESIQEFEWSPKDNIIAYWAPEKGNNPANVTLLEIPSRKELRAKNLFNVSDCKIHWQSAGEYLCVKVLRHTKSKKTHYNNFELFRVKEPLVPVEQLELKTPNVIAFAWEPEGSRFCMLHEGESGKQIVSFYGMTDKSGKTKEVTLHANLENRNINQLHWSPNGNFIVLASIGDSSQGTLEFYDVDNQTTMNDSEHYRVNYVQWDPSGRTFATAVTQPIEGAHYRFQVENGYYLWTFQGKNIYRCQSDNFYQILWRPRPASLLTSQQKQKVVKNLRKYERQFDKIDREQERRRDRKALREKIRQKKRFRALMQAKSDQYRSQKEARVQLYNGYDSDDDSYYVIETKTREVTVSVKEESVN
mmetsp:Transcript_22241/g.28795  ORF Transcript_22241/g.28795 Transcript_22241/m.28795 type:complete len:698 (+) Transcript_22241:45-2138(+)|eukprot:CAMPEP_0117755088 /NCGR_PEP_ID=MMETSP0947-20121206/13236_1 /TAXON_ID=44440 /ORGANISM="Chattonella subsalsa, Strain CCMP2191" /LENGTH=697 /DNA_ID=CAMNT_0005574341 /DNA_START=46 /DNA_END=2142 /DNA_ORIENTATION=-